MLDHLGIADRSSRLRPAIVETLEAQQNLTPDLGGSGSTMSFAQAIATRIGG
jgi:isocitrate dehydrogenase (NAD+)